MSNQLTHPGLDVLLCIAPNTLAKMFLKLAKCLSVTIEMIVHDMGEFDGFVVTDEMMHKLVTNYFTKVRVSPIPYDIKIEVTVNISMINCLLCGCNALLPQSSGGVCCNTKYRVCRTCYPTHISVEFWRCYWCNYQLENVTHTPITHEVVSKCVTPTSVKKYNIEVTTPEKPVVIFKSISSSMAMLHP